MNEPSSKRETEAVPVPTHYRVCGPHVHYLNSMTRRHPAPEGPCPWCRIAELEAVVEKAKEWWRSKKPVAYSDADHQRNPTVNLATEAEKALAYKVAVCEALEEPES